MAILKKKMPPSGVFGHIEDVAKKFEITRLGTENEIHTKVIDIPAPFNSTFRIDDELEPSQYLHIEFEGIHSSYYIGINHIKFLDKHGNDVKYKNIMVDGKVVDGENVQAAFPPHGWWAVVGDQHSVVFDFGTVTHVKEVCMWCANSAATPKLLRITDAKDVEKQNDAEPKYSIDRFLQLAGKPGTDPRNVKFLIKKGDNDDDGQEKILSGKKLVEYLNDKMPENGYEGFLSKDGKSYFVFYSKGCRTRAYNYFFGYDASDAVALANNTKVESGVTINDVAMRAMTLEELQAVRAIIVSNCVRNKWKSSRDKTVPLRPEDVNLYDLNSLLIMPLTKERNCAFKELFASGASSPTYYVSHWWGENVLDFIKCCEMHAIFHGLKAHEAKYWVCAHANRQHDLGTDLGTDPSKSSFSEAMKLSEGVLLVCDPKVVVTTRIWVDYELFRTIKENSMLDIVIFKKGGVHLMAGKDLPGEAPYQKNRRESKFPFKEICEKFLRVQLELGESSMELDKIRILNVMIGNKDNLECKDVLKRIQSKELRDTDAHHFTRSNGSLRAEMACRALSVALIQEDQSMDNFHGFDLLDIIANDFERTRLVFDDLVGLDSVNDDVVKTILGLIHKNIKYFEINVTGCTNLTEKYIYDMELPDTLEHLDMKLGYAPNISNTALLHLATVIPQNLKTLRIDVSGFKEGNGDFKPTRFSDHLEAFAKRMPPALEEFQFVTNLDDKDDGSGLVQLAKSLPRGLKKFTLINEQWETFKGKVFVQMAAHLPPALEEIEIKQHSGEYFNDEDFSMFGSNILKNLPKLQKIKFHARGEAGANGCYQIRNAFSLDDLKSQIKPLPDMVNNNDKDKDMDMSSQDDLFGSTRTSNEQSDSMWLRFKSNFFSPCSGGVTTEICA
jgi:hypothetical protein